MLNNQELAKIAKRIRRNIIKMVTNANSGHIGGAFSATEIAVSLYFNEMTINANNVLDKVRDKFVLSKGHASALLFAVLSKRAFYLRKNS